MDDPRRHEGAPQPLGRGRAAVLLGSIFVVAACGLAYELVAGTLSSYLVGDSVTQFSLVIGLFLTAMGIGSFLSRFVERDLVRRFIAVEIWVGVIGGGAPLLLFTAFATIDGYTAILVGVCLAVGTLVGLEIPLLVRILRPRTTLKAALGNVLSLDYVGALAAALLFPLVLVPNLGLVRTGAVFGAFNVGVALVGLRVFRGELRRTALLRGAGITSLAGLIAVFVTAGRTTTALEDMLYDDDILLAESTPHQRIIVTRWRDDVRLFLNGNLQFSSADEFRYHEALVHPAMGATPNPGRVLVLGGGDGLAVREVLEHDGVESVVLVDLDPAVTRLFREVEVLRRLNGDALADPRVRIVHDDAFKFLERTGDVYDVVIVDLPDPNSPTLGKLYSKSFYRLVEKRLAPAGVMVTQATSPFYATDAFWCIVNTIESSGGGVPGLAAAPYHANVPSFGDWGFVLAARRQLEPGRIRLDVPTRFLTAELLPKLFVFPKDIGPRETPVNRLDNQALVRLYRDGYGRYYE